jgi:CBS domain-containing protein
MLTAPGQGMSLARFKTSLVTVPHDASVEQAARALRDHAVGCLVVTNGGDRAIVTDRDLVVRVLAQGVAPGAPIGDFVTYDPITVSIHEGIETASERMRLRGVRRLPIVDENGDWVGMVTADDLLALLGSELAGVCGAIEKHVGPVMADESSVATPPSGAF